MKFNPIIRGLNTVAIYSVAGVALLSFQPSQAMENDQFHSGRNPSFQTTNSTELTPLHQSSKTYPLQSRTSRVKKGAELLDWIPHDRISNHRLLEIIYYSSPTHSKRAALIFVERMRNYPLGFNVGPDERAILSWIYSSNDPELEFKLRVASYSVLSRFIQDQAPISMNIIEAFVDILVRTDTSDYRRLFLNKVSQNLSQNQSLTRLGICGILIGKYPEILQQNERRILEVHFFQQMKRAVQELDFRSYVFKNAAAMARVPGFLEALRPILKTDPKAVAELVELSYSQAAITNANSLWQQIPQFVISLRESWTPLNTLEFFQHTIRLGTHAVYFSSGLHSQGVLQKILQEHFSYQIVNRIQSSELSLCEKFRLLQPFVYLEHQVANKPALFASFHRLEINSILAQGLIQLYASIPINPHHQDWIKKMYGSSNAFIGLMWNEDISESNLDKLIQFYQNLKHLIPTFAAEAERAYLIKEILIKANMLDLQLLERIAASARNPAEKDIPLIVLQLEILSHRTPLISESVRLDAINCLIGKLPDSSGFRKYFELKHYSHLDPLVLDFKQLGEVYALAYVPYSLQSIGSWSTRGASQQEMDEEFYFILDKFEKFPALLSISGEIFKILDSKHSSYRQQLLALIERKLTELSQGELYGQYHPDPRMGRVEYYFIKSFFANERIFDPQTENQNPKMGIELLSRIEAEADEEHPNLTLHKIALNAGVVLAELYLKHQHPSMGYKSASDKIKKAHKFGVISSAEFQQLMGRLDFKDTSIEEMNFPPLNPPAPVDGLRINLDRLKVVPHDEVPSEPRTFDELYQHYEKINFTHPERQDFMSMVDWIKHLAEGSEEFELLLDRNREGYYLTFEDAREEFLPALKRQLEFRLGHYFEPATEIHLRNLNLTEADFKKTQNRLFSIINAFITETDVERNNEGLKLLAEETNACSIRQKEGILNVYEMMVIRHQEIQGDGERFLSDWVKRIIHQKKMEVFNRLSSIRRDVDGKWKYSVNIQPHLSHHYRNKIGRDIGIVPDYEQLTEDRFGVGVARAQRCSRSTLLNFFFDFYNSKVMVEALQEEVERLKSQGLMSSDSSEAKKAREIFGKLYQGMSELGLKPFLIQKNGKKVSIEDEAREIHPDEEMMNADEIDSQGAYPFSQQCLKNVLVRLKYLDQVPEQR